MPRDKDKAPEMFYRDARITRSEEVEDERFIEVSFSSEEPVRRGGLWSDPYDEVLGHKKTEINLRRMKSSAAVYYEHNMRDPDSRIGVVVDASVEDGKGRARLKLSKRNARMDEYWRDIQDGILVNTSVGYSIEKVKTTRKADPNDPNSVMEVRAVRWTPHEVSMVGTPADMTVGLGRAMLGLEADERELETANEENRMTKKVTPGEGEAPLLDDGQHGVEEARSAGSQAALQALATRNTEINALFLPFEDKYGALRTELLTDVTVTVDGARERLLQAIGEDSKPAQREHNGHLMSGEDQLDKYRAGATEVLLARSGLVAAKDVDLGANEFASSTLLDLARTYLMRCNVPIKGLGKMELVGRAFVTRAAHSTSDFGNILMDAARKSLLKGYEESPETFGMWTATGNLSDFKVHNRVGLSSFSDLDEIPENGEYKHGTYKDRKATIQLATFGKMFSIGRQAIINDDLDALTKVPRGMGRAARRKVGDSVWSLITLNAALSDGIALFHASHGNLAGTAAAPTVTSVDAARVGMALQTDDNGKPITIPCAYILTPVGLGSTFRVLMSSQTDPSGSNSRKPNPVQGIAEVVEERRLTTHSTTAWYLAANPNMFDTIEVGYLDGNPNPYLEQQNGWNVDGVETKVRIDAAAAVLDHRGLYKNAGA